MHVSTQINLGNLSVPVAEEACILKSGSGYEGIVADVMRKYPQWRTMTDWRNQFMHKHTQLLPSPLISVEFMNDNASTENLYRISCDTRGIGIAELVGVRVASTVADYLSNTGQRWIGAYLSPKRRNEMPDFLEAIKSFRNTGIEVELYDSLHTIPSDYSSWICSTASELHEELQGPNGWQVRSIVERSIFWPFEHENCAFLLHYGAIRLSEVKTISELAERFPSGFIKRYLQGSGGKIVRYPAEPRHDHDEKWYEARTKLGELMGSIYASDYLISPLYDSHSRRKQFREHRTLFFIYIEGGYRLLGGYATCVHSGRVEIGTRSVLKPILVF